MASNRLFALCSLFFITHLSSRAVEPSRNDYWDIASGAKVLANSPLRGGFQANAMFGGLSSLEGPQTVFSDYRPAGTTHYVEWESAQPFRLERFHLFAAGDGPIYSNEREFAQFRLKAKRNAGDEFVTVYTYSPTHPYTFVDPANRMLVAANVTPINAKFFRAEFVQWTSGRGFDGPRVIELDGFGSRGSVTLPQSQDDLWDMSQGNVITSSSGFLGGSDGSDIFGTTKSFQTGHEIFIDDQPNGYTHFIEWKTPTPVRLDRFNLFAAGDSPLYANQREFGRFVLKAKLRAGDAFQTIHTFVPTHPYQFLDSESLAILSAELPQVEAQFFRAEFEQWNAGRGYDGPRVTELDAFGTRLSPAGPVADWTFEEGFPGALAISVNDTTGNGHTGQVFGDARFRSTEIPGNGRIALELSSGAHFRPTDSSAFNFQSSDFTLEAIVEPGIGNTDANRGLIVAQNPENGALSYVVDYRSEGRTANFALVAAGGAVEFVTAVVPDDGNSHLIGAVRRGNQISIYLDKILVESKSISLTPNLPASGPVALRVGASSAGYWFHGLIDRVRISRGALEVSEFVSFEQPLFRILEQPQSQTVLAGTNVSFSVTVSSNVFPSYQWLFNGEPIPGANQRSITLANVQPSNAGNYSVRLIAQGQTVTSESALLTVRISNSPMPSSDDLFDISEGSRVTRFSPAFQGIRPTGMFGDESQSFETGSTIFSDDYTNGHTHFIEWRTAAPINLQRIRLYASGDGPIYLHEREFSTFRLKTKSDPTSERFDRVIYTYDATHPYSFIDPSIQLLIDAQFDGTVLAQDFRAEFVQWNAGRGYDGPRVIELDGFGEPLHDLSPTVADWTFEEGIPGTLVGSVRDFSSNNNRLSQVPGGSAAFAPSTNVDGTVSVHFPAGFGGFGAALRSSDDTDFNLGTEMTIEASVRPAAENSVYNRGIVVGQDVSSGRLVYALDYRSEDRSVGFVVGNSRGQLDSVHARLPDDLASHHVAGVLSGGVLRIYLNGRLAESKATIVIPEIALGQAGRVTLGANDIGGYWFNGTLDRVRLSRRALTPEEFFPHGTDPNTPLVITEGLQDAVVAAGTNAAFRVVVTGGTNLTYRWTFNGQVLSNETSNVLQLNDVRPEQAGTYRVVVTSGPWEVSSSASLTVLTPSADLPVVLVHPESRQTGAGMSAPFSVLASSSTPVRYQWFFNGAALPGETNSTLWVVGVDSADAGTYRVVLSNNAGSVSSRGAVLNVFDQSVTGGEVYLDNHRDGIDAPVTDDLGNRIAGPDFLAQLWAASPNQPLAPIGAAVPFGTGENAGYFSDGIARVIPGTTPGTTIQAEVRVWDSRAGRTFAEAQANGGLHGTSGTFSQTLSGSANPARMLALRAFSLASRPTITHQPADTSVSAGRTAFFEVRAIGSNPLSYQWRRDGIALEGETQSLLVLSNVTSAMAGSYTVAVRNNAGITTSEPAQLVVVPRDTQSPVVTLTSPTPGSTGAAHVALAGTVTDNNAVVRAEWSRDGQLVAPLILTNGQFQLSGIVLNPGTNTFSVQAYDADGNLGTATVSVFANLQRAVWLGGSTTVQEGALVQLPVQINSSGDVGALSFTIVYDTNQFTEADFDWELLAGNPFFQANLEQPGLVRATYALPGRTIRAGTNTLARLTLRTRSVPETTTAHVSLDLQGLYSAAGDPLLSGAAAGAAQIQITRREIIGDNNANDRLDVSDASAIIRMLTLIDPVRPWDITGNDLNQNTQLDAGDIVRVLRAVVNIGQPPIPPIRTLSAQSVGARVAITSDTTQLVAGEKVTVRVSLQDVDFPVSGASFRLDYPTNALRLDDETAHRGGPIVPSSAMSLWNVSPEQDYTLQDGRVNFAVSSAAPWTTNNGVVAEFTFTVLTNAATARFWSLQVSQAEAAAGLTLETLADADLQLEGRAALPATVSAGTFNPDTGTFQLSIQGEAGFRYRVEASEDLRTWTEVTIVTAADGAVTISDTATAGASRRFYRLLAL